jgi:flagellar basal-body rod modification protein FlgD
MLITHAAVPPTGTGTGTGTTGTGSTGSTGSTGTTPAASTGTLGGTDFLTLMLAQLQNQDPTSPVDSNTFLSQLAELSEVQGITSLNTSFSTLSSSLSSSQALQASSLLGHQALVNTSTATLAAGAPITGAVNVPQTTSQVVLNISDSSGALVSQINLGAQSSGLANFSWNGSESNGSQAPAGTYTLSAQYAGATSGSTAATTLVNGTVESVSMGAGTTGLTLNVAGIGSVPFSSVQQISN